MFIFIHIYYWLLKLGMYLSIRCKIFDVSNHHFNTVAIKIITLYKGFISTNVYLRLCLLQLQNCMAAIENRKTFSHNFYVFLRFTIQTCAE